MGLYCTLEGKILCANIQHQTINDPVLPLMTRSVTTFSLTGMAQMDIEINRHSNGHTGLTPTFLLSAT